MLRLSPACNRRSMTGHTPCRSTANFMRSLTFYLRLSPPIHVVQPAAAHLPPNKLGETCTALLCCLPTHHTAISPSCTIRTPEIQIPIRSTSATITDSHHLRYQPHINQCNSHRTVLPSPFRYSTTEIWIWHPPLLLHTRVSVPNHQHTRHCGAKPH